MRTSHHRDRHHDPILSDDRNRYLQGISRHLRQGLRPGHRIGNSLSDIKAYFDTLPANGVRVVFEATGSYDSCLRQALGDAGIVFLRVNPQQARDFARACGKRAKTDRIDARMLAEMGEAIELPQRPQPTPEQRQLAELQQRRDQLVADRADEKKRRQTTSSSAVTANIGEHIAFLDRQVAAIERQIDTLIKARPRLADLFRRLVEVPGIGATTAVVLMAQMPELGSLSSKAVAALAGLAPYNDDSGRHRGHRRISGGRSRVRRALYMAALSAKSRVARFAVHYQGIVERSGLKKVALIAVARKLLVAINAMLRSGEPFRA